MLRTNVTTGTFAGGAHDAAPLLVSSVVRDLDTGNVSIFDHQDQVSPVAHPRVSIDGEGLSVTLKPLSWIVFVTKLADKLVASD